ncbi:MAG: hypothetical protein OEW37_05105 [Rhodospirillaceae bacterium]|nr:hypothetical protein [Rhodospirillaceae bacterium]
MAYLTYTATRDIIPAHTQTELASNGGFDSDTLWAKGTGWTIAAGVATHAAGVASELDQVEAVTDNTDYILTYTISGRTAGTIQARIGITTGAIQSADGTVVETITADGDTLYFSASADFDGSIDDVSLILTNSFSINFGIYTLGYNKPITRHTHKALDGSTETVLVRRETTWDITTGLILYDDLLLSGWLEFFASVGGGESFTLDVLGYADNPRNPVSVILEDDPVYNNENKSDYWRISFQARALP